VIFIVNNANEFTDKWGGGGFLKNFGKQWDFFSGFFKSADLFFFEKRGKDVKR